VEYPIEFTYSIARSGAWLWLSAAQLLVNFGMEGQPNTMCCKSLQVTVQHSARANQVSEQQLLFYLKTLIPAESHHKGQQAASRATAVERLCDNRNAVQMQWKVEAPCADHLTRTTAPVNL
jgi:hypothetical protein